MICLRNVKNYCSNYEKIENYEQAVKDIEMWVCHHRLETVFTHSELRRAGWYYDRKPEELIFIRKSEHQCNPKLHIGHRKLSEETKAKISAARKGKKHSKEHTAKIAATKIGNKNVVGKYWFNNGIKNIRAFECPEGFVKGRIHRRNICQ